MHSFTAVVCIAIQLCIALQLWCASLYRLCSTPLHWSSYEPRCEGHAQHRSENLIVHYDSMRALGLIVALCVFTRRRGANTAPTQMGSGTMCPAHSGRYPFGRSNLRA